MLHADGKVITPLFRARPGDTRVDPTTGEILPRRADPHGGLHVEGADVTEAKALLRVNDRELGGWGRARRAPQDPDRPRIARSSQQPARSPIFPTSSSTLPRPSSRGSRVTV
jgi:hypothetical protein